MSMKTKLHLAEKKLRPLSAGDFSDTRGTKTCSPRKGPFSARPHVPEIRPHTFKHEVQARPHTIKHEDFAVVKSTPRVRKLPRPAHSVKKQKAPPPIEATWSDYTHNIAPGDSAAGPAQGDVASPLPVITVQINAQSPAKTSAKVAKVGLGDGGQFEEKIGRSGNECVLKNEIVVFAPGGVQTGTNSASLPEIKRARIRNTEQVRTLEFDDDVLDLDVFQDLVCCVGENRRVSVWNTKTLTKVFSHDLQETLTGVSFAPDGSKFAVVDNGGLLTLFGEGYEAFRVVGEYKNDVFESDDASILAVAFSQCGSFIAIGDMESKVTVLTVPELVSIAELTQCDDVHSISFSLCGVYLASGSGGDRHHGLYTNKTATSDMRVVVWTMPTEAEDFKYMGQCIFEDVVFVVKFSPDSKWLSVGTDDACVSLLSVDNNFKKLIELAAPAGVRCMAWSYDSRFLAIGGVSKTVDVWDLAAQQLTFSLPPAADWITAIVFSPTMCELLRASFGEPVHIHTLEWEKVEVPNVGKGRRMSVQKMKSFAEVSLDGLRSKKFQRVELGNAEESAFTVIVANEKCMRRPSLLQCPPGASVVGTPQKLESIAMNVIKPCGGAEDAKSHHRASVIRLGQVVRLRADDFPQLESDTPEICWHSMDDEIEALCISRDGNFACVRRLG